MWARRAGLRVLLGLVWLPAAQVASANPIEELFAAIRKDDQSAAERLLLRGVSANTVHPVHGPAIVYAAQDDSPSVVQALLLSPALDLEARNGAGETALMLAAARGNLPLVKLLVARKAQVNQPGWTALHYAAGNGRLQVVEYLLEQSGYIDAASPNGTTPLMLAARQEQATVARFLVEQGADPTLRNQTGLAAADYSQRNGDTRLAEWLRAAAVAFARKPARR